MKHKKIINLLDNTSNQPFKFRTKNLVGINNDRNNTYDKKILDFKLQC